MKYLMIDGNNMACRCAFANEGLTNSFNIPSGVHYGVFKSLISLKEKFPDYQYLIVWDGKSKRRMEESKDGVKKGLIKSAYKENRKKDEQPKPLLDFYDQSPYLKRALGQTGIPQIRLVDFEADDVIASYCKKLDAEEIICLTSDKDYYQLLTDKVKMYDGMKQEMTTEKSFIEKFNISPSQHVDVGSLMGDTSDNIFGIAGWGEKTSIKSIQEHGTWQKVIASLHEKFDSIREKYPDVKGEAFKELVNVKTPKGSQKYPEINEEMPFTGVALAFEKKEWKPDAKLKKGIKNNLMALMMEERIGLAYSLKKMDDNIEKLPEISNGKCDPEKLMEYFDYYEMESLKEEIYKFKG